MGVRHCRYCGGEIPDSRRLCDRCKEQRKNAHHEAFLAWREKDNAQKAADNKLKTSIKLFGAQARADAEKAAMRQSRALEADLKHLEDINAARKAAGQAPVSYGIARAKGLLN